MAVEVTQVLDLLQILVAAGKAAAERSDSQTAKDVARLAAGLISDAKAGMAIDPKVAEHVREIGADLDAMGAEPIEREAWEALAGSVRASVSRWNSAG